MGNLHRSQWLAELKRSFPELTRPLNAEHGLLAFEMEVFSRFIQRKIANGDRQTVIVSYSIALKYFTGGNKRMRDAIDTCLVENLPFGRPDERLSNWAWAELPVPLKDLYRRFHDAPIIEGS